MFSGIKRTSVGVKWTQTDFNNIYFIVIDIIT